MNNEQSQDMRVQFADPTKIVCKDCKYRDKATVKIGDKVKQVGITKCYCEIFPGKPDGEFKPLDILFRDAKCDFYKKE